jgi:hypothetical protein
MPYGFDPRKLGWKPYRDPILPPQYPWESVDSQLFYNGNGNTGGTAPTNWGSGSKTIVSAGNLVKEGYTFKEWNTNSDGTGTSYQPGSTITIEFTSITLYAIWEVVEVLDDSFVLSAQLLNGDVIDGIIGSSNGYYKVQYWDGTTEIKQTWTTFQKTCTSSGDGSMGSYGPKLIKIWPCDVNGVKGGEIFDVNLTNNKYLAFTLNKVPNLRFLTVKNNQVITKSDLNFSLLTKIERITLENLPSFTGSLSFTNVSNWVLPIYYKSDWTITNNRSEWDSQNRLFSILTISNLPITSLDLSNLGGLYSLQLSNCSSLTTINTTNCTSMESFDIRESLNSLQPINLSTLTYLGSLIVENAPNVTSITLPQQPLITMLSLRYISITSLDLSAMTILNELSLFGISTLNSTLETSFYSNTLLRTTLNTLYLDSVNFTTANFSNYSIERFMLYNLPNVASISLPSTTIYLDIHRLPSMNTSNVDSIFTQLDGFGLSNGELGRSKYGENDLVRTTSSDSAIASLASKGWYFFGHSFQTIL